MWFTRNSWYTIAWYISSCGSGSFFPLVSDGGGGSWGEVGSWTAWWLLGMAPDCKSTGRSCWWSPSLPSSGEIRGGRGKKAIALHLAGSRARCIQVHMELPALTELHSCSHTQEILSLSLQHHTFVRRFFHLAVAEEGFGKFLGSSRKKSSFAILRSGLQTWVQSGSEWPLKHLLCISKIKINLGRQVSWEIKTKQLFIRPKKFQRRSSSKRLLSPEKLQFQWSGISKWKMSCQNPRAPLSSPCMCFAQGHSLSQW